MREKLCRKYRGIFYKRIKHCKMCGSKGYMAKHGNRYICACLHCTRSGDARYTKFGALLNWNRLNGKL